MGSSPSPILIGSELYRQSSYGRRHPLAIPRVSSTLDLIRAMGWLAETAYRDSPCAAPEALARFHDRDYIAAVRDGERDGRLDPERCRRYRLGCDGNPIFPEMFRRPATAVGASLLAVQLLAEQGRGIVYSPAGGTHHGRPDRASGFCYFNDPVLACLDLIDRGITPVYYVDLDAHHGDGVEDAFAADDRVFTVSVHEEGRWPFTGTINDSGRSAARNLPVPPEFNDDELAFLIETVIVPLGVALRPAALVIQCGADALADDPLSRLALSNGALWRAVAALLPLAPRVLVLGGGGYNPWSVCRCWAGIWATLTGVSATEPPTAAAEAVLRALRWERSAGRNPPERWFTTIADPPRPGPIRQAVRAVADAVGCQP